MTDVAKALAPSVLADLRQGVCEVTFQKADGSIRVMKCTLSFAHIPQEHLPKQRSTGEASPVWPEEAIRCYEIDLKAWRSFRVDKVLKFVPLFS